MSELYMCMSKFCACMSQFCACMSQLHACMSRLSICLSEFCACLNQFNLCLNQFRGCVSLPLAWRRPPPPYILTATRNFPPCRPALRQIAHSTCHSFTVLSALPLASVFPSSEKATELTELLYPVKVCFNTYCP